MCTIYYAKSHAAAIVGKFVKGMSTDEGFFPPEVDVVSLYIDHVLESDIGVDLARETRGHSAVNWPMQHGWQWAARAPSKRLSL